MPEIVNIFINNFKSLIDISLPPQVQNKDSNISDKSIIYQSLGKLTCLVGLNGSGKSTVLHAIDFIGQLFRGNLDSWLMRRAWKIHDIKFNLPTRKDKTIHLKIAVDMEEGELWEWEGYFSSNLKKCLSETVCIHFIEERNSTGMIRVKSEDRVILHAFRKERKEFWRFNLNGIGSKDIPIIFKYDGSILSALTPDYVGERFASFIEYIKKISSLDLLSPHQLRLNYKKAESLGAGGEGLFAYMSSHFNTDDMKRLISIMQNFYPELASMLVQSKVYGWKQLFVEEAFSQKEGFLKTEAHHVNDGMLRLIAIVAQTLNNNAFLLFDELENGINPELAEKLVDYLTKTPQQILITTHSPLLLNYLTDEQAKESVLLLYKKAGETRCMRLFDIPDLAERLEFLGAGSSYVDIDLPATIKNLPPVPDTGNSL